MKESFDFAESWGLHIPSRRDDTEELSSNNTEPVDERSQIDADNERQAAAEEMSTPLDPTQGLLPSEHANSSVALPLENVIGQPGKPWKMQMPDATPYELLQRAASEDKMRKPNEELASSSATAPKAQHEVPEYPKEWLCPCGKSVPQENFYCSCGADKETRGRGANFARQAEAAASVQAEQVLSLQHI